MSQQPRQSTTFHAIAGRETARTEYSNPFAKKMYLVVDSVPEMQRAMAMTLNSFGGEKVEYAGKASDALVKLMRYDFDVVLCDYDLGTGNDGLYLYEEARARNLLKQSCVFMIVSGERRAAKVISAAELAPDGYLLKPFTGVELGRRLEVAMRRREAFKVVDDALMSHDYLGAIEACNKKIGERGEFALDFMKLKGSLALKIGDYDSAQALYKQVLQVKELVWAKLGMAKALAGQKQVESALAMFEQVIVENDRVMEAYDWLARLYQDNHDLTRAQDILKRATELSPATVHRHQVLAEVAEENGDLLQARSAYNTVLNLAKSSWHRNPAHYAALVRTQLACGEKAEAARTLASLRRDYKYNAEGEWMADVVDSTLQSNAGNKQAASRLLESAAERLSQLGKLSDDEKMEFARVCYTQGQKELGDRVARDMVRNHHDNQALLQKLSAMFDQVGQGDAGRQLIASSVQDIVNLNNQAVHMAQMGEHDRAIALFRQALEEMPQNVQLMLNLANAVIAQTHRHGWNETHIRQAHQLLQKVREMEPANNKFQKLLQAWRGLISQHQKQEFQL
ncbi:tetratricopeptide repeat protein [Vogesella sp. LIG4]|uniref:tetratricopeptide repeat protein n=1 Tax=Vogesella sp. LIG4 TaxID=1192162 RepID=UPI00081FFF0C|nr:tetratricopeptide repeat protein [Vogesella sp. LIG4]SCK10625.1 Response regulator containing a CheY-like receiver domain and an HTH DNA-binding domain [Vogesella sp. LIG4]